MGRAEDLFSRIENSGIQELDRLIDDRDAECLFLDFKRSPSDGEGRQLHADDNKSLSKSVSGFGNSEGGVLIWGVDCRRQADGVESSTKFPLQDVRGFRTKVEAAISRASIPPHALVRCIEIMEGDDGRGYLAVLVPKSNFCPLRSTVTSHYHLRAGSNFEIVPHDALAGMFGRSPRPVIGHNVLMRFARLDERRENFVISIGLCALNVGSVLAERPYLSVWLNDLPPEYVHASLPSGFPYDLRRGALPNIAVVGKVGTALPPGGADDICNLMFHLPMGFRSNIELQCVVGASGADTHRFTIRASGVSFPDLISRAMANEGMNASQVFEVESVS